jgi:hemolysin D
MLDHLHRHWDVLKASWSVETELRKARRQYDDQAFLPAALEVMERPPSPLGRIVLWMIIAFVIITVLWAVLGTVDVVATAQGKIIPSGRAKIIQPSDYGVVRAIHVRDGQSVRAGDLLIELDPTESVADAEQARRALQTARVNRARARALLAYLEGEKPKFAAPEDMPEDLVLIQKQLIDAQIEEQEAKLASLEQKRAEARADIAVVERDLAKLHETLPLIEEQVEAQKTLLDKGLTPKLKFLEQKERLIAQLAEIKVDRQKLVKAHAALAGVEQAREQTISEFRSTVTADLAKAEDDASLRTAELSKAERRNVLQQLKAPVDGTVQQLALHTVGGVVKPADPLMVIVPRDSELVVDAAVLNRDIGFVHEGDAVEIKLEAFPFTKYGVINGTLENLSSDAIDDEKLGPIYQARVAMASRQIMVQGKAVNLSPGMAATAEIKTGQRRIIEFILDPLLRYRDEALRER